MTDVSIIFVRRTKTIPILDCDVMFLGLFAFIDRTVGRQEQGERHTAKTVEIKTRDRDSNPRRAVIVRPQVQGNY